MTHEAPDFNDRGYPSDGEIIGPLWQSMWDLLLFGREVTLAELVRYTDGHPKTIQNLLREASKRGIVLTRREDRAPRRCYYWLPAPVESKPLTREFLQQQLERSQAQSAEATRRYEAAVKEEQEFLAMIQAIKARDAAGQPPLDTPDQGV